MIYSTAETAFKTETAEVKVGKHILNVSLENNAEESDMYIQSNELFSAAISSSICAQIKRHVVLKQWEVSFMHVSVSIFDTEMRNNRTYFHCDVTLKGKLTEDQMTELKAIANNSDVYRMLQSALELNLELS
jgi:ribosome-associated translation inhibitor RaiA